MKRVGAQAYIIHNAYRWAAYMTLFLGYRGLSLLWHAILFLYTHPLDMIDYYYIYYICRC